MRLAVIRSGLETLYFTGAYRALRRELPWLKRLPSETIRDHVRFTTQPLEQAPEPEQLVDVLQAVGGEDLLLFSTDYPHWDWDDPKHVLNRLPPEWRDRVMHQNAAAFYGERLGLIRA